MRVTVLRGKGAAFSSSGLERRLSIYIVSPVGGPADERPLLNGEPICATAGGAPIVLDGPDKCQIETVSPGNDLFIVEEF